MPPVVREPGGGELPTPASASGAPKTKNRSRRGKPRASTTATAESGTDPKPAPAKATSKPKSKSRHRGRGKGKAAQQQPKTAGDTPSEPTAALNPTAQAFQPGLFETFFAEAARQIDDQAATAREGDRAKTKKAAREGKPGKRTQAKKNKQAKAADVPQASKPDKAGKSQGRGEPSSKDDGQQPSGTRKARSRRKRRVERHQLCETLTEELLTQVYDCMVCYEPVKRVHAVWSCKTCFTVFHFGCIQKWASSSTEGTSDDAWRCPGCQALQYSPLKTHSCFCGKLVSPSWSPRGPAPHTCGDICGKENLGPDGNCTHPCKALCHAGPCPPCPVTVAKSCHCGKRVQRLRCSVPMSSKTCGEVCRKMLNCGLHRCEEVCHAGDCKPCAVTETQQCYCGQRTRVAKCGTGDPDPWQAEHSYSCGELCGAELSCGNHTCERQCHKGPCGPCPDSVDLVHTCPCGRQPLRVVQTKPRTTCLDPIPTCQAICGALLPCSATTGEHHTCQKKCYSGDCGPCDRDVAVTCKCRHKTVTVPCGDFGRRIPCDKMCNTKLSCGRHRCKTKCCEDRDNRYSESHRCLEVCNKLLGCKLHRCDLLCHAGHCPPCQNTNFEDLACECGKTVMEPPIPCGTPQPACRHACSRQHACDHPVRHTCHTLAECPPCTELVKRRCRCGREMRNNISCHITSVSCGKPCGKPLSCGNHTCDRICHDDPCESENPDPCKRPCVKVRPCGHPCTAPCHGTSACPQDIPCRAKVRGQCSCGRRRIFVPCGFTGESTDVGPNAIRSVACDAVCEREKRNKALAEAFNIKDPNLTGDPTPVFSEFLLEAGKRQYRFVKGIEDAFAQFLSNPQAPKYAFPNMKHNERQIVHELAEVYGFESESFDEEPYRNVVVFRPKRGFPSAPTELLSAKTRR